MLLPGLLLWGLVRLLRLILLLWGLLILLGVGLLVLLLRHVSWLLNINPGGLVIGDQCQDEHEQAYGRQ